MKIPKHIIIATGIYPPDIGGPAQYAKELFETFLTQRYSVSVISFGSVSWLVTGLRHIMYFFKLCANAFGAEYIIALDTFSVALPVVLFSKITGAHVVIRVGGDFLWETYIQRTKELILLSNFYTSPKKFSLKEKIIFSITKYVLQNASMVVFSTEWQKNIWTAPYGLHAEHISVIENFYPPVLGEAVMDTQEERKVFLSPSRDRVIKNKNILQKAWNNIHSKYSDMVLDTHTVSHELLQEKISRARAVIVPSFSEVSPNIVIDALAHNVPSIVTHDTGITDRLHGMVMFVDPFSPDSVAHAIDVFCDEVQYAGYVKALQERIWSHSWNEIAQEYIDIFQRV